MGSGEQPQALPPSQLSRRRLLALGGATAGLAAALAACGNDDAPPAAGRVGEAPPLTDPPEEDVNDVVLLRTLTSLSHSTVRVYESLSEVEGLDQRVAGTLARFIDDHTATAAALAELTSSAGGEPYECANTWLMDRTLQPAIDNIVGTTGDNAIEPSDDPTRDAMTMAYTLETVASASDQLLVTKLADPALRTAVMELGAQAGQRAAVAALLANEAPEGLVSPLLIDPDAEVVADDAGFLPVFAISSRYGQLTPVEAQVGAANADGVRYTVTLETPADNAYIYESLACEPA
jgi:hypothetical protein